MLMAPILKSGIAAFDPLSTENGTVALNRLSQFLFPKFDNDDPDCCGELFDDSKIVD